MKNHHVWSNIFTVSDKYALISFQMCKNLDQIPIYAGKWDAFSFKRGYTFGGKPEKH